MTQEKNVELKAAFFTHRKLVRSNEIFSYYAPHPELSPYIAYYSIQHKFFSKSLPLFIPDLGGSIIISRTAGNFDMTIWGPFNKLTSADTSDVEHSARYFIEFQPGGLSRLIYSNCSDLLNNKTPLKDINAHTYCSLSQIFERYSDSDELLTLLDNFFLALLRKQKDKFSNGRFILNLLQDLSEAVTVKELSLETHYSSRQINRYINNFAGVSSKGYIKIKRFNKAIEMLKRSSHSIEQIAFSLGYYDAAHFVHDFTILSGLSPLDYRKSTSDFYNEGLKKF